MATRSTVAFLLLMWIAVSTLSDDASASVSSSQCQADYQALVLDIEANREKALKDIRASIVETANNRTRTAFEHELERVWDDEETQRNQASLVLLDCLRAAKASAKSAG